MNMETKDTTKKFEVPAKKSFDSKRRGKGGRSGKAFKSEKPEFDQKILDLARVTRVMAGGKRMNFRACVAIGDHKGRVAIGLAKGADVTIAINKAVVQAQKKMITVPIVKNTIPHELTIKRGASKILFRPAPMGCGIKAGGVVRVILELAGIPNVSCKIFGSGNKVNNAKTTINALKCFKLPRGYQAVSQKKSHQKDSNIENVKKISKSSNPETASKKTLTNNNIKEVKIVVENKT